MPLVHKEPSYGTRSRVEVLVRAPDGKVDVPVVQSEIYVAGCVCAVPADGDVKAVGVRGDGLDVEVLPGVELDAGEEDEGCGGSMLGEGGEDALRGDRALGLVW